MSFQKLPLEIRLAIWEATLVGGGRFVGAYPDVDPTALRPGLPVIAHINRESRNFFNGRYIRIRDRYMRYLISSDGPDFQIEDYVYVNGEIDTLTMGETAHAPLGLNARERATLRTVWLVDSELCAATGFGDLDDILDQEEDKPVARLPELLFPNLDKIYLTTYRIEYSVKEWDDCFGFYVRYHAATGKVFMQQISDFDEAMWLNKRRPDAEDKFTEEGFHIEIEIDRSPSLEFVKTENAWYVLADNDGNDGVLSTASMEPDVAVHSPTDTDDDADYSCNARAGCSTDSAAADTKGEVEPELDPFEYLEVASVHWRMVWHVVAQLIGSRMT
ncbi:hypothetical protein CPLU01_10343 [Colletotrichum plurivorum]|uniref:2EXR domain-containing protein n=1 Tax=Colletotrichum plurivorum TaxID=2175906 RepID=A0A8H6K5M5_9PEZI|nr:hypothetical protein CPLU01_10343 [Colletotrichum plurivorum]